MLPPTSEMLCPGVTVNWLPCTVMAPGFDPKNPNAATGDALNRASAFALGIALNEFAVGESQIVGAGESHHAADVHCCVRTEQEPGWVHQEEVGVSKPGGLYRTKDVGEVPPGDTTEDVGCGQTGVIEKIRDVVVGNIEVPEAMVTGSYPRPASSHR